MTKQRVLIVGASHGGHEFARQLLQRYDDLDITIYEAGDFVSFMSCGMELYLENQVTSVQDVRNFTPEELTRAGVHVLNNHQVTAINADKQTVTVLDTKTQTSSAEHYDKLLLSSGVNPVSLPVPGNTLQNVFLMRGYDWATAIKAQLENSAVKQVTIIGAGYIGLEAAEAARKAGKEVTVVDTLDRPLATYLNPELSKLISAELEQHGVHLLLNAHVEAFTGDHHVNGVVVDGKRRPADLIIQAAGVKPNTKWLAGTVGLNERGFINTDEYLRTNLPNVYAIGDATLALSIPAGRKMPIALATVVRREARYLAQHLFETLPSAPFGGVCGSSALSVFNYHFASTGLNSATASRAHIDVATAAYTDTLRPSYVPAGKGNPNVHVQLFYAPATHKLLGGTVLGKYDLTAQGNVLALAVRQGLRLEDLAEADFFFQPGFDRQWSLLNLAAQHALGEARF